MNHTRVGAAKIPDVTPSRYGNSKAALPLAVRFSVFAVFANPATTTRLIALLLRNDDIVTHFRLTLTCLKCPFKICQALRTPSPSSTSVARSSSFRRAKSTCHQAESNHRQNYGVNVTRQHTDCSGRGNTRAFVQSALIENAAAVVSNRTYTALCCACYRQLVWGKANRATRQIRPLRSPSSADEHNTDFKERLTYGACVAPS